MAKIRSFMDVNPNAGSPSPLSTNYNPSGRVDSSMPKSFAGNLDALNASFPVATDSSGSGSAFGGLMTSLIPSLLGSFGSTALNALFSKISANRQYGMNKSLMDYQNLLQRDMLTDEMALKIQGYKNAGLSTASLAGNFGGNVAVPSSNVSATQAQANDPRLGDIMNAARQVKLQEDAIQSQIDLNEANAEKARASAGVDTIEADLRKVYGAPVYELTMSSMSENTKKTIADRIKAYQDMWNSMDITGQQILNLEQERKNMEQVFNINVKTLPKQLALLAAQAYAQYQAGNLSKSQASNVAQQTKNLEVQHALLQKNLKITDSQLDIMREQLAGLRFSNNVNALESLKAQWTRQFMTEKGYGYFQSKMMADDVFKYLNETLDVADKSLNLMSKVYTMGASSLVQ